MSVYLIEVQLLYLTSLQDLYYQYGFTEKAFNFQAENYGKGGCTFLPPLIYYPH